jgi:hypothetical protein
MNTRQVSSASITPLNDCHGRILPSEVGIDGRGPVAVNHAALRRGPQGNAPPGSVGRGILADQSALRRPLGRDQIKL